MNRRKQRETVFKLLYLVNFHERNEIDDQFTSFFDEREIKEPFDEIIKSKVLSVMSKKDEIDSMIAKSSTNWTIDRIGIVDKSILRLIIFEALFEDEVPVNVAVNEGVELAKKYSGNNSKKFINAVARKVLNG